ncbi:MAG: GyrI-like domain-containing protein [Bacteroidales bacterium]|nr:GyrI-like domain-containing protein [Bacteroidales bacterium]MCF8403804.1 GyrI-like domain-containing protein [Bacteroidales bacterium]
MKALKIVVFILLALLAIFLVSPLFMPGEMFVERNATLTAPPEVIWDQVNCLENWEKWDVWHQDTNMVSTYSGPECGVDAKNSWTYTNMEGGGAQTIIESKEYSYIKTFLEFQDMGTAEAELMLEKTEEGTKVSWNIKSDSPYPLMRWINTFLVKPGVETAYESGLANLEELTKDMKAIPYSTGEITIKEVESVHALAIRSVVEMDGMEEAMGSAFGQLMGYIETKGMQIAGYPFAIWYVWDGELFEFDNCIPTDKKIPGKDVIKSLDTYAGKVVTVTHKGDYSSTYYSWEAVENYVKENGLEVNGNPWETYITDPQTEPDPSKWITELYWPIK